MDAIESWRKRDLEGISAPGRISLECVFVCVYGWVEEGVELVEFLMQA